VLKYLILSFSSLLIFATSSGQTLRERVMIKGGPEAWENLHKEMYMYPSFRQGVVEYRNGQLFKRPLNFNRMLSTIQFIDERNDTLAIANESAVKSITIDNDVFIFIPECLQLVANNGSVKLYRNVSMRIADVRQVGAFGTTNTSTAIESNNQVYSWMSTYSLNVNETLLLGKITTWYIQGSNNEILPANKKNILKVFSAKEDPIKDFIRTENINFNREADLVQLTAYISRL
jgi:hypothetical protein